MHEVGLARDAATYLSELIERGCVAHSLGDRAQNGDERRKYFDIGNGCNRLLDIHRPVDVTFDETGTLRLIRAWTLSTEFRVGWNFATAAQKFLGPSFTIPQSRDRASDRSLLALIKRLDVAEQRTRKDWRKGRFSYADYALVEALCAAADGAKSSALKNWAQEQSARAGHRSKMLAGANKYWRPMLKALLEDPDTASKPLDHPEYIALTKLPRDKLGLAFVGALEFKTRSGNVSLDAANLNPSGTVTNIRLPLATALGQIF